MGSFCLLDKEYHKALTVKISQKMMSRYFPPLKKIDLFVTEKCNLQCNYCFVTVDGILRQDKDDDYLALACMNRLIGRGYDQDIRRYCKRRIGKDEYYSEDLKGILARVNAGKGS